MRGARPRGHAALVRAVALLGVIAVASLFSLGDLLPGSGAPPRASAEASSAEPLPETDTSIPAHSVTMIGATPQEPGAPGSNETWGVGRATSTAGALVVRYTSEGGWSLGPGLLDSSGQPLGAFKLAASPLAGTMTSKGAGVLIGTVKVNGQPHPQEVVLVRNPAGAFQQTPAVPAEGTVKGGEVPLLKAGETLLTNEGAPNARAPMVAALDEESGGAGALIVPVNNGSSPEEGVLHWDGKAWTRETIEVPAPSAGDFRVLAIAASSPTNAWLLAQLSSASTYPPGAVGLFHREHAGGGGSEWTWKPAAAPLSVPLQGGGSAPFTVNGIGEPPNVVAQLLSVTGEAVWIDGERADLHTHEPASATLLFKEGSVTGSWCFLPSDTPAGTTACQHELPEALPNGPTRSISWANSATPFGERVITGLPEGVTLRLGSDGSFARVLGLGATPGAETDPGAAYGAAFATATEGWLGEVAIPVHLTLAPAPSQLKRWPVPFRHPLVAIATQPGAPVAALSSEALAVGDQGAVARYKPGLGWLPESLFGPGQRVEKPRLRGVAWPTPSRAYAVGDKGEMWLWRGETGLWERDPATPLNFRGNLLGVAFDPNNPTRGYAVGSSEVGLGGVLLRYGKSWTPEESLPAEARGASFTSIAFAGSEAIVTYHKLPNPGVNHYVGGLLVNNGSGWHVDQGAAEIIGENAPEGVAGLADGGAAFVGAGGIEGTRLYERESAGAAWRSTPVPGFGGATPTLFREGGALRAIVTIGGGANLKDETEPPAPPGFPPNFIGPYNIADGGAVSGSVVRQTASGWSDEGHELNPAGEVAGGYAGQDLPYRPDTTLAVLVDPTGSYGWAVGGNINDSEPRLETGDVARYREAGAPPGASTSPVPTEPARDAVFAIGGDAQCAAPCADRALTGVGPDVWLSTAVTQASQVPGVRAFLYTGPSVTAGEVRGLRTVPVPFAREFARTSEVLASDSLPVYVAATSQDRSARPESEGTEASFLSAFGGFHEPFGNGPAGEGLPTAPGGGRGAGEPAGCPETVGCAGAYYAFNSQGASATVRVIVLDDSREVDETQLAWLSAQLSSAKEEKVPAIVVGAVDLNKQVAAGERSATEVVHVLYAGNASAYFFDAQEEDVHEPLVGGDGSIEAFGSGTLGYVNVIKERFGDFHGASGFLLAQVEFATYNPNTNRAHVSARLIPNIGELALEAKDGTLLRRSEPALFSALARRPRAGCRSVAGSAQCEVDPYIPIPENCVGAGCAVALQPEYSFGSSNEEVGGFVKPNLAVSAVDPHAVLQNSNGEPERELGAAQSGLFCAYNQGTTMVTISAGGLSSSLPVTVEAGSVRQPCGTVRLKNPHLPTAQAAAPVPPPPAPAPGPNGPAPATALPPIVPPPPPPIVTTPAPPAKAAAAPPPFIPLAALPVTVLGFVPPPVPTPARPTPPSGTSAVTSPIEVAEKEEESEEATEQASNQAVAYRPHEHDPSPAYLLGIVVIAALAGVSLRRPRGGRRDVRVAPATLGSMRAQRRLDEASKRRR